MKSLRELIAYQGLSGKTDIEIIYDWFIENNMEIDGLTLITQLAKTKANKLDNELNKIRADMSMYAGADILYKTYKNDIASKLNLIIIRFILGFDIEKDYPQDMEWLKENIPNLKLPPIFWKKFLEWLESKGIYFKGEKDVKD